MIFQAKNFPIELGPSLADVLAVRHPDEVAVPPHEGGLAAQADHGANVAHRFDHELQRIS